MLKNFTLLIIVFVACSFHSFGQETIDLNCSEAGVYISPNTSFYTSCSELFLSSDHFWNEGLVFLDGVEVINCENSDLGPGVFNLNSEYDVTINGDNIKLGTFNLNLPSSKLHTNANFEISKLLFLNSGLLVLNNGNELFVSNEDEDAIIFNNSIDNESYIAGTLKRAVRPGISYFYPLGNEISFRPFVISNASSNDILSVTFDENIPFSWQASNVNPTLKLEEGLGWRVSSDHLIDNKFTAFASKLDDNQSLIDKDLHVFYSSDAVFFDDLVRVASVNETLSQMYLESKEQFYTGAYSLVENVLHLDDIPNAIIANERNETRFKFETEKFKYLRLRIYDSFGREIYKNNSYANEFDTKDFTSGTYYYYLEGELLDGKKIKKNDILEIIRTED
ncbi:gliding motility-associated C-terminal domain-containing protein [Marinifilum sp.]|uniref:T9SS type B sorting domain-containing protein n=1 Tax=Marinifilum sp. TaxID=2033137 RepID=UPI003BAB86B0